jgi:hypothetical protein
VLTRFLIEFGLKPQEGAFMADRINRPTSVERLELPTEHEGTSLRPEPKVGLPETDTFEAGLEVAQSYLTKAAHLDADLKKAPTAKDRARIQEEIAQYKKLASEIYKEYANEPLGKGIYPPAKVSLPADPRLEAANALSEKIAALDKRISDPKASDKQRTQLHEERAALNDEKNRLFEELASPKTRRKARVVSFDAAGAERSKKKA